MDDLTGQQLGPYQLVARIGRGGMSMVYRARRLPAEPEVAIKVMDTNPDTLDMFMRRFEQEAQIVKGMQHPNVLPLLDYGHADGYPFMVTPLVSGGTLADIMRRGPLSIKDTGGWLYQVAGALHHAHQRGVVHRDLKPTNILLDEEGHAFLTDFGIAKLLNMTSGLTLTGNVIGTPTYMAPEQWRGEEASPLTDVYGLGVLVFLMLTSAPPFQAESPHSLMYKHLNEPPPSLRGRIPAIPEAIDLVVAKALAKDARHRYPTAEEFSHDYQRALHGLETLAQRQPPAHLKRSTNIVVNTLAQYAQRAVTTPNPPVSPQPQATSRRYAYEYPSTSASRPYNPNVLQRLPVKVRQRRRLRLRSCLLLAIIVALISGFAAYIGQNPDEWLPADSPNAGGLAPPPFTPTPTIGPNVEPRVEIIFPQEGVFLVNNEVIIRLQARDSVGITRLEVRRFGYVIETITPQGENRQFSPQIRYTPRQPGRHLIEIIPYRGDVRGPSAIVDLVVQ